MDKVTRVMSRSQWISVFIPQRPRQLNRPANNA